MKKSTERHIVVLYDKDDVEEFNIHNKKKYSDVFVFSPGLELFLNDKENLKIYKPDINSNSILQKKIIINSKKIYQEFESNFYLLEKLDKGIIENIHNILFVSVFSFMYLIENLKKYNNFGLFYNERWEEFNNFENFIPIFLEKIFLKKSQGFFNYLKPRKLSKTNILLIKLNNIFCNFYKNGNIKLIVGSILTKKIFEETNKANIIVQLKPSYEFKFYHIFLNIFSIFNFFKRKKIFYFFPLENDFYINNNIGENLKKFFDNFKDKNFNYFKKIVLSSLLKYCENQMKIRSNILKIVDFTNPKCIFVDQLRFGVATMLASIGLSKKIDVILVPSGSISVPDSEFSEFVLHICARGLIYSKIANYSVSQSKISNEAIKYYDNKLKILKSKPILFGKKIIKQNVIKKNKFIFLHASTPKSLSKWPWIYENYNEYIKNIKELIDFIKIRKGVELIIRFREGPECDLKTFKNLININQNNFVKISENKDFLDDLSYSDCLISFSSTSIEETLFLNKSVLIYSGNRQYRHINYKFNKDNDIYYANEKNINDKLDIILNENQKKDYNILWNDEIDEEESLKKFY